MISKRAFVIMSAVSLCSLGVLSPGSASANVGGGGAPIQSPAVERVQPLLLADVVVNGQQPAPTPAPAPVVVQPQEAPAPVVETPARHTTVIEHEPHNYMSTIALSALMGGVAGVLVGGAIYYLADNRQHSTRILYWGAGGVLVGTAVGVVQVASEESRLDRAAALPTDPAPTYRLALYDLSF
jgi:hypothetical protein